LTAAREVTDSRVVKAYAHPLRVEILRLLEDRVASPTELATELGAPLSNTSYHVRRLEELGLIELRGRILRRGAVEHRYAARVHTSYVRTAGRVDDEGWTAIARELERTLTRIERLVEQSETRVASGDGSGTQEATVILMRFAGPEGGARRRRR
jgi:DNA-binding transcriptional ArsR family regulator